VRCFWPSRLRRLTLTRRAGIRLSKHLQFNWKRVTNRLAIFQNPALRAGVALRHRSITQRWVRLEVKRNPSLARRRPRNRTDRRELNRSSMCVDCPEAPADLSSSQWSFTHGGGKPPSRRHPGGRRCRLLSQDGCRRRGHAGARSDAAHCGDRALGGHPRWAPVQIHGRRVFGRVPQRGAGIALCHRHPVCLERPGRGPPPADRRASGRGGGGGRRSVRRRRHRRRPAGTAGRERRHRDLVPREGGRVGQDKRWRSTTSASPR